MTKELKPCPFCGGEADCNNSGCMQGGEFKWMVECIDCGVTTECFDNEEQAIEAWNRRKPLEDIVEQLEAEEYDVNCNICDYDSEIDTNTLEYYEGKEEGIREAIEIVKGGAV